ncbi:MAG: nucleotidyltransferase domain-containing protein [Ignavibacteriaceae bacterium]
MKNSLNYTNDNLSIGLPVLEFKLKQLFGDKLRKIILYGSYARGTYDNESDVDILVIINDQNLRSYNKLLSQIELELFSKFGLLFSIIPENENYFLKNSDLLPFFRNVFDEGVVVYG